jgi:hypothetical protein
MIYKLQIMTKSISWFALRGFLFALGLGLFFLIFVLDRIKILEGKNLMQSIFELTPLFAFSIAGLICGIVNYVLFNIYPSKSINFKYIIAFVVVTNLLILWISLVLGFSAIGLWD